jgi:hypothetical protein
MLKSKCCSLFMKSIQMDIEGRIFCSEGSKSNLADTLQHMIPTAWFQPQEKQTVRECKCCCTYGSKYQHKVDQRDTFARTSMWSCQRKVQTQALGTLLLSANQPLQFALHSRVLLSAKNPPGHYVTHLYVVKSANELSEIGQ